MTRRAAFVQRSAADATPRGVASAAGGCTRAGGTLSAAAEPHLVVPTIQGRRVRLRAFAASDVAMVLEASADPSITALTTVPAQADPAAAPEFIQRQHGRAVRGEGCSFAVTSPGDGAVGQIGLWLRDLDRGRASVGYWIVPSARRRGFALDALLTLSTWAERLPDVHRLELVMEPTNEASQRTAERAGYQREGLLRSWQRIGSERHDLLMYGRVLLRG